MWPQIYISRGLYLCTLYVVIYAHAHHKCVSQHTPRHLPQQNNKTCIFFPMSQRDSTLLIFCFFADGSDLFAGRSSSDSVSESSRTTTFVRLEPTRTNGGGSTSCPPALDTLLSSFSPSESVMPYTSSTSSSFSPSKSSSSSSISSR